MRRILLLNLVLLVCGLIGCSGTRLSITVTRPAEVGLKNYDKIAIKMFREGSGSFTSELRKALFQSERFEVLDYDSLKMVLNQTDGGNEEKVRKPLGNIALISGTILRYEYSEDLTHKDDEEKDKKTGKVTTTRTYYLEGIAEVRVRLRIVDLHTSKILVTRNFDKSESAVKSWENSIQGGITKLFYDLKGKDTSRLFKSCRTQIISSFMRVIAPYTERVYVSVETAEEIPELERGFKMAKQGNWDAAIDIFQKVTETYSNSPLVHKAYYNLGLGYMYTDQFDQARTALEEAYARKPESKYQKAIKKLNVRIEDNRRLKEQRPVDPYAK